MKIAVIVAFSDDEGADIGTEILAEISDDAGGEACRFLSPCLISWRAECPDPARVAS